MSVVAWDSRFAPERLAGYWPSVQQQPTDQHRYPPGVGYCPAGPAVCCRPAVALEPVASPAQQDPLLVVTGPACQSVVACWWAVACRWVVAWQWVGRAYSSAEWLPSGSP